VQAAPASVTVKYQRIETLGPGPVKGKRRDRAYFAIMYAAAECDFLGNGMEACGISRATKKRDTLYVLLLVVPPRPVQLVWKNSPRGLSTRS
jgi:hypothetical protein